MCILTNNCALLCVFVHLWFVQKEATNTLMIKTTSFVQYSSAIYCMSLWIIFLHYHHQWSYCFDMVVNTQFCGIFYCFYSVSYTSMSNGQKFIANMFIFTFILSTIVSMSIKITNNYDCLLPVSEWNNNLPKTICKYFCIISDEEASSYILTVARKFLNPTLLLTEIRIYLGS